MTYSPFNVVLNVYRSVQLLFVFCGDKTVAAIEYKWFISVVKQNNKNILTDFFFMFVSNNVGQITEKKCWFILLTPLNTYWLYTHPGPVWE